MREPELAAFDPGSRLCSAQTPGELCERCASASAVPGLAGRLPPRPSIEHLELVVYLSDWTGAQGPTVNGPVAASTGAEPLGEADSKNAIHARSPTAPELVTRSENV